MEPTASTAPIGCLTRGCRSSNVPSSGPSCRRTARRSAYRSSTYVVQAFRPAIAYEDHCLSEADLHDLPPGVRRAERGRRRLRRGRLLHRSHSEGEAEGAAEEGRPEGARAAPYEGRDLQEAEAGGSRLERRRDRRSDGQAPGLDSAADRREGKPRDPRTPCGAVERDPVAPVVVQAFRPAA